jgi:hypothetical protein
MAFEKVVVSTEEISQVVPEAHAPPAVFQKLPPPIPLWTTIALSVLVLALPVLCIVAVILRVAFRTQPPRVRGAMTSLLSTLLIVSGLLFTLGSVLAFTLVPVPAIVSTGLADLDEKTEFPVVSPNVVLSGADVSSKFKPLVIVVSPSVKRWHQQEETASNSFGAGMLLEANKDGYLFATANHVAMHDATKSGGKAPHVMVSTAAGIWSSADVIAQSEPLDMALLWVPRHSGKGEFIQPIVPAADGEPVFVIGHPEGLKYTLSTGLISGLRDPYIQISAAISPGNSGGPVYDTHGDLIGVVSSKFDHNRDANAENLGFAARAEMLREPSRWTFFGDGRKRLDTYLDDLKHVHVAAAVVVDQKPETKPEQEKPKG